VEEVHAVLFQPTGDRGGSANVVAFMIPEATPAEIALGLAVARDVPARVVMVCESAEQAKDMAALARAKLPDHRRVPLERAAEGGWGLPS
jgi:hypothetical protein